MSAVSHRGETVSEPGHRLFDISRFAAVVPTSKRALQRLNHLLRTADEPPRIAVLGKYNHGKSALLNALVGTDHFQVADKRETVAISEYEHDGAVWIDTPGLDVDPTEIDDRQAQKAAFSIADFLLLVHRVDEGDLDRYEIKAFMDVAKQDRNYRQKVALVFTQIDQSEPADVRAVEQRCRTQLQVNLDLRELDTMSVSAVRYANSTLRSLSGMDSVFAKIQRWKADTRVLRRREWSRLTRKVLTELADKKQDTASDLKAARDRLRTVQDRLERAVNDLVNQLKDR